MVLKNVIINKIDQFVFTEDQLRGKWQHTKETNQFEELNNQELIDLAKKILDQSSPSELEAFSFDSAWRTPADSKGKVLSEDDTDSKMHIELIDTDLPESSPKEIVIDRLRQLACLECGFHFSIEDFDIDASKLNCPSCGRKATYDRIRR